VAGGSEAGAVGVLLADGVALGLEVAAAAGLAPGPLEAQK
jgi:hypothetical protein